MPYFPLFIDITDSACAIIGGGHIAERRAKTLLEFGARPAIIAPELSSALQALAREGLVSLKKREYAGSEDIQGALLVCAATNDHELNVRIARDARKAGIPVNVADAPALCTFFFPALVRRGELVAGITTSGSCPALASRLRRGLEAAWPADWDKALEELAGQRRHLIEGGDTEHKQKMLTELIDTFLGERN
ncbi:MAG: bifunctional precorrin-2 dehydrogenase/sirohydrochlorin ferrochelatase [Treponema sp.]|jgi:siroheme synthase-like protein|nr:bifunctional precorrin-2 dehydrogenase/sirohydrochlorin ferrochelatase [Treponema sp.]